MGDENKARISQGVGNAESNVAIATQTGDKNISEQNNRMIIILLLLCK
jgi:hypothetical protein